MLLKFQNWEVPSLFGGSVPHFMPLSSTEILVRQRLYCCLEIFLLLEIQLHTTCHELLKKSYPCKSYIVSLRFFAVKNFAQNFRYGSVRDFRVLFFLADLKMSLGLLEYLFCLILHILSSKYFIEGFGAFSTFLHPLIV